MKEKKERLNMVVPMVIMGILALVLLVIAHSRGQHIEGLKSGLRLLVEILPLLILAFIVAGMVRTLMPHEVVLKWIGGKSGIRGVLVGTVAGACAIGGPFISLPFAAGLLRSGAGVGTVVAFLTAWSLWACARLPMEIGILGWKFTLIRFLSVFFFPPIAGMAAQFLVKIIK